MPTSMVWTVCLLHMLEASHLGIRNQLYAVHISIWKSTCKSENLSLSRTPFVWFSVTFTQNCLKTGTIANPVPKKVQVSRVQPQAPRCERVRSSNAFLSWNHGFEVFSVSYVNSLGSFQEKRLSMPPACSLAAGLSSHFVGRLLFRQSEVCSGCFVLVARDTDSYATMGERAMRSSCLEVDLYWENISRCIRSRASLLLPKRVL